ncbi:MAG: hypothetical protein HFJ26_03470 [Clostridia bacterium]|nr:hypothetical protein [Clostridia bacterium]
MLCENCGDNEANVRYTQIVNGVKKEMVLCEDCAKKLGIGDVDFNMPINLSSFFSEFFEDTNDNFLPEFTKTEELPCKECGMTYDEFMKEGKFGCANCYDTFLNKIDPILKNLHASNQHVGRKGKITKPELNKEKMQKEETKNTNSKTDELKEQLKQAIKEERYEDAAKIRDEIKKIDL